MLSATTPSNSTHDKPRALVLRAAGTNCDRETAAAFELAGASASVLHINRLLEDPGQLHRFELLSIAGGFSYGDDIASGRIFAERLAAVADELRQFINDGKPIIGICNGFQVLVQAGLLPGEVPDFTGRTTALTWNTSGVYQCRWVRLKKVSPHCVWTAGWDEGEVAELPIAHAEGRIMFASPEAEQAVEDAGRIAMTYDGNPNGSALDVAGLTDETGLVLGLMPHPERFIDPLQHPAWTRKKFDGDTNNNATPAGLRLFQSAVSHVVSHVVKTR